MLKRSEKAEKLISWNRSQLQPYVEGLGELGAAHWPIAAAPSHQRESL